MDCTNWKWGKADINILTFGIAFKGIAVSIYWELLDKRGNSDTEERIALVKKFIDRFGKSCIAGLLADREFIGQGWFSCEWRHEIRPIKTKTHRRPAVSLFRYGLDYIVDILMNLFYKKQLFSECLDKIKPPQPDCILHDADV